MDKNRAITYSLLAHINDASGIKDLNNIFIPLVKRALARMNSGGFCKGQITDIKVAVDTLYSLDIPFPILKRIVKSIAQELNASGKSSFSLYETDYSFIIDKYVFLDYEETIVEQEAEIQAVHLLYEKYLKAHDLAVESQPSIFDFLDKNRFSLAGYFAQTSPTPAVEHDYAIQANFINDIKAVHPVYKALKRIYVGSIITNYLEANYVATPSEKIEFLLDTNFIISTLDLHSAESTHTCLKIIELCGKLNYRLTVLSDTISETRALLERTAENFDRDFLGRKLDQESIYNACERKNLFRTDLQNIATNLERRLSEDFGIYTIPYTEKYQNLARCSPEYEVYRNSRVNKDGALHDITALMYIREKRKRKVKAFHEATHWFVSDTRNRVSMIYKSKDGFQPEAIRAEDLVNLLWLSNPSIRSGELIDASLTKLISSTISGSLPSTRLLREFDDNLQKYARDKIQVADCVRLSNRVASNSVMNLEGLNTLAQESPDEFVRQLNKHAKAERQDEEKRKEKQRVFLANIKEEYEKDLKVAEQEINHRFQAELEELRAHNEQTIAMHVAQNNLLLSENGNLKAYLREQYQEKALVKWQRMAYVWLLFCVLAFLFFLFQFVCEDWPYNYAYRLTKWAAGKNDTQKELLNWFNLSVLAGLCTTTYKWGNRLFSSQKINEFKQQIKFPKHLEN